MVSKYLPREVPKLKVAVVVIIVTLVFFLAPIIPYLQPISVPGAYSSGLIACLAGVSQSNATLALAQELSCQNKFMSPPATVFGFATPAYDLLGYGSPPFPTQQLVTQGNHSALVFFKGSRAVAVEDTGQPSVVVNPSGVVEIESAAVSSSDFGFLNITFHLRNISYYNITNPIVYLSMVGFSSNDTVGGLALIEPKVIGSCGTVWASADYCNISQIAPNNLPVNKSFTYYSEVRGVVNGNHFLYREGFGENYPTGGVGPLWVKAFINNVDRARRGVPLTENATLDAFAALRFKDASANYQISDYNLSADAISFFGQGQLAKEISEVLLYPGIYSPYTYPTFLAEYAVGHWDGLLNTVYTQYGYYVGEAPYYDVSIPCPVYEIPGPGINITQFFHQHGCTTTVASLTWLVIIMSP